MPLMPLHRPCPIGVAYIVMAYIVMAYIVTGCVVIAYILMAYILMASIVMAYIVTAYKVMAGTPVNKWPRVKAGFFAKASTPLEIREAFSAYTTRSCLLITDATEHVYNYGIYSYRLYNYGPYSGPALLWPV